MNLYFTDSLGNRTVIAKDISDPSEALEKVLAHQASRFIHTSGACKINTVAEGKFNFADKNGKPSGYTLEA